MRRVAPRTNLVEGMERRDRSKHQARQNERNTTVPPVQLLLSAVPRFQLPAAVEFRPRELPLGKILEKVFGNVETHGEGSSGYGTRRRFWHRGPYRRRATRRQPKSRPRRVPGKPPSRAPEPHPVSHRWTVPGRQRPTTEGGGGRDPRWIGFRVPSRPPSPCPEYPRSPSLVFVTFQSNAGTRKRLCPIGNPKPPEFVNKSLHTPALPLLYQPINHPSICLTGRYVACQSCAAGRPSSERMLCFGKMRLASPSPIHPSAHPLGRAIPSLYLNDGRCPAKGASAARDAAPPPHPELPE